MNYNVGVLTPKSPITKYLKSASWDNLPDDLRHDLHTTLLTPGFHATFWARHLNACDYYVTRYRETIPVEMRSHAIANFNSITRDDAIRLAHFPGPVPIVSAIQIATDRRDGWKDAELARVYKRGGTTIRRMSDRLLLSKQQMPDWFRALIPGA